MADLTQTLVAATRGDKAAETQLDQYVLSNYAEVAKALAAEIATDGKPVEARQMASVYLKNTLNAKSQAHQHDMHERWKRLDPKTRQTIKDTLLTALRSQEVGVPRFAAVAASEIACVELPFNEWPTFVPAMTEALSAAETPESVKLASLECLGFTCERIVEVQTMLTDVPDLPEQTVNSMLTAIVQGVQPDRTDAIRYQALSALNKSLEFVQKNMEVPAERDFIIKNAICGATQSADNRVRELAFQSLDVVAQLYYDKLQDYMTDIYQLTSNAIQNDADEEVKKNAIEFWVTIADTEEQYLAEEQDYSEEGRTLDRAPCKKYVESAMQPLIPLLLGTLSQQQDDSDEDVFDLRAAGATLLEAISTTVGAKVVPHVIPFVQQHITSENWRMRDAAIVAFSSIMEGPPTAAIGEYVSQSIPVLMTAFTDQNEMVRDSATHCISTICKLHMEAVPADQVHGVIQGLIGKFQESPRLASRSCTAIFNLCASLKTEEMPETNLLSAPMMPLMKALLGAMDRRDAQESNLRVSACAAASELIGASARDSQTVLRELLPAILSRMDSTFKWEEVSNDDRESKAQMLASLSGLVTALFQRLEPSDLLPYADRVVELLMQELQIHNANCHEEAFLSISAIATCLEENFTKYLDALMPYLITGLRSFQALELCQVSVGVVADICPAVGAQIQPYCDQIMGALTECLKDSLAHRDTKPVVFSCFGDIAMAIGAAYEPYLGISTMLLMQAASAPIPSLEDDDLVDFINRLRLSVMEAYTGIIIGLADGNVLHLFLSNVSSVMQFLQFLSTPESYKDDDCLQKAVGLLGDIAHQMGTDQNVKGQLRQPFVQQLIQEASSSASAETREIAMWAQGMVQQAYSG